MKQVLFVHLILKLSRYYKSTGLSVALRAFLIFEDMTILYTYSFFEQADLSFFALLGPLE